MDTLKDEYGPELYELLEQQEQNNEEDTQWLVMQMNKWDNNTKENIKMIIILKKF